MQWTGEASLLLSSVVYRVWVGEMSCHIEKTNTKCLLGSGNKIGEAWGERRFGDSIIDQRMVKVGRMYILKADAEYLNYTISQWFCANILWILISISELWLDSQCRALSRYEDSIHCSRRHSYLSICSEWVGVYWASLIIEGALCCCLASQIKIFVG